MIPLQGMDPQEGKAGAQISQSSITEVTPCLPFPVAMFSLITTPPPQMPCPNSSASHLISPHDVGSWVSHIITRKGSIVQLGILRVMEHTAVTFNIAYCYNCLVIIHLLVCLIKLYHMYVCIGKNRVWGFPYYPQLQASTGHSGMYPQWARGTIVFTTDKRWKKPKCPLKDE